MLLQGTELNTCVDFINSLFFPSLHEIFFFVFCPNSLHPIWHVMKLEMHIYAFISFRGRFQNALNFNNKNWQYRRSMLLIDIVTSLTQKRHISEHIATLLLRTVITSLSKLLQVWTPLNVNCPGLPVFFKGRWFFERTLYSFIETKLSSLKKTRLTKVA